MINVGIIGGAGYTGGETLRLLIHHPEVNIQYIHSRSNAGVPVTSIHKDLYGDTDLVFADIIGMDVDVIFLCLGHGESKVLLENLDVPKSIKIIDLSQDFRNESQWKLESFVYGLPEWNRSKIQSASYIANPGCFATAIQLGLLPIVDKSIHFSDLHITGITGSTGAGQKLQATTHHSWRNNNVNAYKTLNHQHIKEIKNNLFLDFDVPFIPWRGDFTRGIYVSTSFKTELSVEDMITIYKEYYASHPFTHVCDFEIDVKQVVNTNKCFVQIEKVGDTFVVHSAIDNLLKGAAGQAVQNMNLMFGLPETAGLLLKPTAF
jgi:N-acetyl-gamma-glutamyl-phosphate reductase